MVKNQKCSLTTNRAGLGCVCVIAVIIMFLPGCKLPKGRPSVDMAIDGSPGISVMMSKMAVRDYGTGESLRLNDLILVMPEGWSLAAPLADMETGKRATIKATLEGHVAITGNLSYVMMRSWVADPPSTLLVDIETYLADKDGFFAEYDTDLKFFSAIHNVTPDDRDKASGEDRRRRKLLLYYKSLWGDGLEAKLLQAQAVDAIIFRLPRHKGVVAARVFDKDGVYRASIGLGLPERDWSEAEELVAALLVNSSFGKRTSDANAVH